MARQFLDDAYGPDEVRVTIAVEPAVRRLVRAREMLGLRAFALPFNRQVNDRLMSFLQTTPLRRRWAVAIETDTGLTARIRTSTREEAVSLARATWHDVRRRGVTAVADLGSA